MDETKITDDFTRDTDGFLPVYREIMQKHFNFVTKDETRFGYSKMFVDPDQYCYNLYQRHLAAWRRGQLLPILDSDVQGDKDSYHLLWKRKQLGKPDIRFGSDTIFTDFVGYDDQDPCHAVFKQLATMSADYLTEMEKYTKECYQNIGGFIIFPRMIGSINTDRGDRNLSIKDRFDLTLDCIRRYYNKKNPTDAAPLNATFAKEENIAFFNLFSSFKDYVDFFCLQGLVNGDYTRVINLMGDTVWVNNTTFEHDVLPRNQDEYKQWMQNQLDFIRHRTTLIKEKSAGH